MSIPDWNRRAAGIVESYDAVADAYAKCFARELEQKPFDRELIDRWAQEQADTGRVCDLGCGPGQVSSYLAARGVDVFGVDLSRGVVETARRMHPDLRFEVGDARHLNHPDSSLAGIVAFYSWIHLERTDIAAAMHEATRLLAPGGRLLVAMHVGDGEVGTESWLGQEVAVFATLVQPAELAAWARHAGLAVDRVHTRSPYDFEYPSERVFLEAHRPAVWTEPFEIRAARQEEHMELTALAHAAKRSHGDPESWIRQWRTDLSFSREYIAAVPVCVATRGDAIIGVVAVGEGPQIDHLWVAPAHSGAGVGRALLMRAADEARRSGANRIRIESDPGAEGFYLRFGARRVGEVASVPDGRRLPLLYLEV